LEKNNSESVGNTITVTVNPKLYPLEAVYSAAYVFIDKAYIVLDGDPEKEILVNITPKFSSFAENIKLDFNNELLNYAEYLTRAKETKKIRELFLQRLMGTNDSGLKNAEDIDDDFLDDLDSDDDFLDDPDGIAIPWEEKYGNKDGQDKDENNLE